MPIRIKLSPSFIICMCIGMTPPSKPNKDDESIKQAKPSKTYAGEFWFMWLPGSQGLVDTHLPSVFLVIMAASSSPNRQIYGVFCCSFSIPTNLPFPTWKIQQKSTENHHPRQVLMLFFVLFFRSPTPPPWPTSFWWFSSRCRKMEAPSLAAARQGGELRHLGHLSFEMENDTVDGRNPAPPGMVEAWK